MVPDAMSLWLALARSDALPLWSTPYDFRALRRNASQELVRRDHQLKHVCNAYRIKSIAFPIHSDHLLRANACLEN